MGLNLDQVTISQVDEIAFHPGIPAGMVPVSISDLNLILSQDSSLAGEIIFSEPFIDQPRLTLLPLRLIPTNLQQQLGFVQEA